MKDIEAYVMASAGDGRTPAIHQQSICTNADQVASPVTAFPATNIRDIPGIGPACSLGTRFAFSWGHKDGTIKQQADCRDADCSTGHSGKAFL